MAYNSPSATRLTEHLRVCSWNVRTLSPTQEQLLNADLKRLGTTITCVQETRWQGAGTRALAGDTEYAIRYSGHSEALGTHGVGIIYPMGWSGLISSVADISPRLMRIQFRTRPIALTVICGHAPHAAAPPEESEAFWRDVDAALRGTSRSDYVLVGLDANARLGQSSSLSEARLRGIGRYAYHRSAGREGLNEELLEELLQAHSLRAMNTWLTKRRGGLASHIGPGGTRAQLDYILVRARHGGSIQSVSHRWDLSAQSDHAAVCLGLRWRLRTFDQVEQDRPLDFRALLDPQTRERFQARVNANLGHLPPSSERVLDDAWEHVTSAAKEAAETTLPRIPNPRKPWMSIATVDAARRLTEARLSGDSARVAEARESFNTLRSADYETFLNNFRVSLEQAHSAGDSYRTFRLVRDFGNTTCRAISREDASRVAEHFARTYTAPVEGDTRTPPTPAPLLPHQIPSAEAIAKSVNAIRRFSAPGLDGMSPSMLHFGGLLLEQWVTWLIQESWRIGRLPQAAMKSLVVPLAKRMGAQHPADFRAISLIPVMRKVYESLLGRWLLPLYEASARESQHGFRQGRSTTDLILSLSNFLAHRSEFGRNSITVFFDYSQAFDSVYHHAVEQALSAIGADTQLVARVSFLLRNSSARVKVGAIHQDVHLTRGLPQGSPLSPMLFSCVLERVLDAIEDEAGLPRPLLELLFADDLCAVFENVSEAAGFLAALLHHSLRVGLRINSSKCGVLSFPPSSSTVSAADITLPSVQVYKYLGCLMDSRGRLDADYARRSSLGLFAFHKLKKAFRRGIALSTKTSIYALAVRPVLLYGAGAWVRSPRKVASTDTKLLRKLVPNSFRPIPYGTDDDQVWIPISNDSLLSKANLASLPKLIKALQWRLLFKVARMHPSRVPHAVLKAVADEIGRRPVGRPVDTWHRRRLSDAPELGIASQPGWRCLFQNARRAGPQAEGRVMKAISGLPI